jgi:hypothetical protein
MVLKKHSLEKYGRGVMIVNDDEKKIFHVHLKKNELS